MNKSRHFLFCFLCLVVWFMENNINFIRFANLLEDMLEKYGAEVMEEILEEDEKPDEG